MSITMKGTDMNKTKKTTEQKASKVQKQPRTIKVRTVVVVILWTLSMIASLIAGWTLKSADNDRVSNEARVMLDSLIDTRKSESK